MTSQRYRSDYQTDDPEQYFRITVALPLLDDSIESTKKQAEKLIGGGRLNVIDHCVHWGSQRLQYRAMPEYFYVDTLPVTTCTAERTFYTVRMLKSYLRNLCGQERSARLALMSVHRENDIPTQEVINKFAMKNDRKLNFVL